MAVPRTPVLAGAGVVLLASGFALGVLEAGNAPPEVRVVAAKDPDPAPSTAPAAPAPPPAAAAPVLPAADLEALRAVLSRFPDTEVPAGTGVIAGVVRAEEGGPLAGVEVSLFPEAPRSPARSGPPSADPDPAESAVYAWRWSRFWRNSKRTVVTDASGAFRFEGLADVQHRLEPKRKGWQFRAKDDRQMYEARIGAAVEILATPSVEVRVEVSWPGAAPPDNLQVQFLCGNSSSSHGYNPAHPVVTVKPGTYEVSVRGGDHLKSEIQTVEIPAEGDPPVLRFTLKGRPGIRGRLLFPEGEETDQAQVHCQKLLPGQKAEPAVFASSLDRGGGRHREPGTYSLPDLAPGRFAVGVSRGWNLPVVSVEEVEVGDGPVERDLRVPPLQPGEYVALTVLGPDGSVVRDFQISTGYRSKTSSSSGGSVAATRPDGTRWVLHHGAGVKTDADGTWWIEVSNPKYGTKRGEYRRGAQDSMTLRFEEVGRLDVRLEGFRGHTHEGRLRVTLQQRSEDGAVAPVHIRSGEEAVGEDGTKTFLQVQPGDYVVLLQVSSDRMPVTIAKANCTVKGGRNEVAVRVPPLYAVTVTGGESIFVCRGKDDPTVTLLVRPDAEGKAVLDGLPEGEYEIRGGPKSQTFRVPGTTEVKL